MNTLAQDLFTRALELPESERDAFLTESCGGDAELRLEEQRMLVDAETSWSPSTATRRW